MLKQLCSVFLAFVLMVAVSLGLATPAHADYLVTGAKITNVQNTSSNGDNFAVSVKGGSGPCTNRVIIFPKSGVAHEDVYERGYDIALAAMSNDYYVDIYDYSGSDCAKGGQLSITK